MPLVVANPSVLGALLILSTFNIHMMLPQAFRKGPGFIALFVIIALVLTLSVRTYPAILPAGSQYFHHDEVPATMNRSSLPIPPKIWQIFSTPKQTLAPANSIDAKALGDTTSWIGLNPGYQYTLLGASSADAFVTKHFSQDQSVMDTYFSLHHPGLKTDLLRRYYFHLAVFRPLSQKPQGPSNYTSFERRMSSFP